MSPVLDRPHNDYSFLRISQGCDKNDGGEEYTARTLKGSALIGNCAFGLITWSKWYILISLRLWKGKQ